MGASAANRDLDLLMCCVMQGFSLGEELLDLSALLLLYDGKNDVYYYLKF